MVKWKPFLWLFLLISSVNGYKILMLLPLPGPSHFLMFKTFIRELVGMNFNNLTRRKLLTTFNS